MPYVREIPKVRWFFRHPRYMRYLAREVTCLFIAAYTLLLVWGLKQLAEGPAAWQAFLEALRSPASSATVPSRATRMPTANHSET